MIELPESHVLAGQIDQALRGRVVQTVEANASPHGFAFYQGDPALYGDLLAGKRVDGAVAYGGQVLIRLEDACLRFNDGVNMRLFAWGDPLPKKHQLHIQFEDGMSLICTVQMYGGLLAYLEGTPGNFYQNVAEEKPSPLTAAFDSAYFMKLFRETKPSYSAKAFLATEQRIPGLGNGVLQDILFNARIHPKEKLGRLTDADMERLFHCVKQTLAEMTIQGGRDTEKDLFGASGGYRTLLSKKTLANPCPVCGDVLVRQAYLGGNIYFCPTCQPLREA